MNTTVLPCHDDRATYLTIGFPLDFDLANHYADMLRQILNTPAVDPESSLDLPGLLEQEIARLVDHSAADRIAIPLTGGLDSRSILGACLRLFPRKSIITATIGSPELPDVQEAKAVCDHLGVTHYRLDPNEISWSSDRIVDLAKEIFSNHATYGNVSRSWLCRNLEFFLQKKTGSRPVVISGYLGDVLAGRFHVRRMDNVSIDRFLKYNATTYYSHFDKELLKKKLRRFLSNNMDLLNSAPGWNEFDILDFCFRQPLRTKGVTVASYEKGVAPYQHPSLIAYWFRKQYSQRKHQSHYRQILFNEYREVFCLPKDNVSSHRRWIVSGKYTANMCRRLSKMLGKLIGRAQIRARHNSYSDNGLSSLRNDSRRKTYEELVKSFDRRSLFGLPPVQNHLNKVLSGDGTQSDFEKVVWAVSFETHIRAGNI
jgi:hypothetical protein